MGHRILFLVCYLPPQTIIGRLGVKEIKFSSARTKRTVKPKDISKALILAEGKRKRVGISHRGDYAKVSVASGSVAKEWILSEKIETLLNLEEKKERIMEVLWRLVGPCGWMSWIFLPWWMGLVVLLQVYLFSYVGGY